MVKYLGRKQNSINADWLYAVEHIEDLISPEEVEGYAEDAVKKLREAVSGKKAAYGWSGGKDSIVLGKLCERAGVTASFFGHCDLEFPSFLNWALENKPAGCEVINTHVGYPWLYDHPEMLFVDDSKRLNLWYGMVQRKAFSEYYSKHKPDMLIVGHRVIDGNVCGSGGYIRKKSGEVRYSPIADWPHEAILGYLHYNGLELPPSYGWEDGYVFGPTPWPIWGHPKSERDGWRMIYELDPTILPEAAKWFDSARDFLEEEVRA